MNAQTPITALLCCSLLLAQSSALGMEKEDFPPLGVATDLTKKINNEYKNNKQQIAVKKITNNSSSSSSTSSSSTYNELEQSMMITPIPTTRGFGLFRSAKDWIRSEEENLYWDLVNKTFDTNNSSYHRKLSTAIETYVNNKNDQRITDMLEICRKDYHNLIKVEDSPALMAHIFLVQQNKEKQQILRATLESEDKRAIDETNSSLATLKESILQQINKMNQQLADHTKTRDEEIEKEGNEIRRLKKGLHNVHKLNRTFVKPTDAYCSDDESSNPEDVVHFYNDDHILQKIQIDQKLRDTDNKIKKVLAKLISLNSELQAIQDIRY